MVVANSYHHILLFDEDLAELLNVFNSVGLLFDSIFDRIVIKLK